MIYLNLTFLIFLSGFQVLIDNYINLEPKLGLIEIIKLDPMPNIILGQRNDLERMFGVYTV